MQCFEVQDNVQLCQDLALFDDWKFEEQQLLSHKGQGKTEMVTYAMLVADMADLEKVLPSASLDALKDEEYLANNIRSLARGDFEKGEIHITAFKGQSALIDFIAKYNITGSSNDRMG